MLLISIKDGLRRRFADAANGLRQQITALEADIGTTDGPLEVCHAPLKHPSAILTAVST
jgi:hypothetical protein